uniref:Uncharacterized protein n=1 Tax=Anguilla anguilla TaxID=7936 RepID=A0A0E9TG56_ANGAN
MKKGLMTGSVFCFPSWQPSESVRKSMAFQ